VTSSKNPTNDNSYFDAVLVGGGIMSSTLALLISEVLPDIKFLIIEKLNAPGSESTGAFNNAGTGHAANCELNYTPLDEKGNIKIDKILSSEWCRCKDTANYAFGNFQTFDALNSFYDERFAANETKQINDLKNYIKSWESDKNLVFVTHYVVISSILNTGSSSGEIIISDKNFNIIGSVNTM